MSNARSLKRSNDFLRKSGIDPGEVSELEIRVLDLSLDSTTEAKEKLKKYVANFEVFGDLRTALIAAGAA